MPIRSCLLVALAVVASSPRAFAQNWSVDARDIAMGGVGSTGNLSTKMIDEERGYTSIVLPIGLIQVFGDTKAYDPNSPSFNPVRAIEYAANPFQYVIGRDTSSSGETAFVNDIRNATLSRDLSKYKGFAPANDTLAEGLVAPNFGHTFKVQKTSGGGFQGVYVGAGPYLTMQDAATIDQGLTGVLATGVNVANAHFPIANTDLTQLALAVTGGYRGRFAWPSGVGAGSEREGLYLAANYNFLYGFGYENDDLAIRLDTDSSGLIAGASNMLIDHRHATSGTGFAIDVGAGAVIDRWEVGFGAQGLANRINWSHVEQTTYELQSLTSGNSDFTHSTSVAVDDTRVEVPVDYRGNVAYRADRWSAAVEAGHGFGGGSFHGGVERRFDRIAVRGGARYTFSQWNPAGGVGFDFSPRVSIDVAASGTTANLERKRQMAIAASLRINHLK